MALGIAYLSCQFSVILISGQSNGSYLHYFSLFVNGRDVLYATFKATVFVFVSSTIQSYYGFVASGARQVSVSRRGARCAPVSPP